MFAKDFNLLNEIYNQRIFKEDSGGQGAPPTGSGWSNTDGNGINGMGKTIVRGILPRSCDKCCPECGEPEDKCKCHPEEADMVFANKPVHKGYDNEGIEDHRDSHETNGYMAKQQCFRIAKMAAMLHELVKDEEELSPWIAAKITQSFDDLNAVFAYKDYEDYRDQVEGNIEEIEEGSEQDFIDSINKGGSSILNQIKRTVRNESKETIEGVLLECIKALEAKKK
jgi:hypothetical protein